MKPYHILLTAILLVLLACSADGQVKKTPKKVAFIGSTMSSVMGRPVYESTRDSLTTKIWIISKKQYMDLSKSKQGKVINAMKSTGMKMDQATMDSALSGTHYIIYDVVNKINGRQFADSSAKVEIVSPVRQVTSLTLQPMLHHFGRGLNLREKGEYLFTINLNIDSSYQTTQFKYRVK